MFKIRFDWYSIVILDFIVYILVFCVMSFCVTPLFVRSLGRSFCPFAFLSRKLCLWMRFYCPCYTLICWKNWLRSKAIEVQLLIDFYRNEINRIQLIHWEIIESCLIGYPSGSYLHQNTWFKRYKKIYWSLMKTNCFSSLLFQWTS